ncbi:hypothetical protein LZ554_004184 [Drepanopeziza brunnea f. sp. 'monogermtubi']|nr:hypothetical protein LZ554_004184 [Drepanopeziza brunnea f. sp. 'monogermtubi']
MASALRNPWIHLLIEEQFTAAFEKFKDVFVPGQDLQRGHYHYERKSGSIVIQQNKGRRAQFLAVHGKPGEQPEGYAISDGTNKICVDFDLAAVDAFRNKDGRSLDEIHRGIIVLGKYDLGGEGSQQIGRPGNVSEHERIKVLLGKLENLLAGAGALAQPPASPIRSQEDDASDEVVPSLSNDTLAGFATQVDYRKEDRRHDQEQLSKRGTADLAAILKSRAAQISDIRKTNGNDSKSLSPLRSSDSSSFDSRSIRATKKDVAPSNSIPDDNESESSQENTKGLELSALQLPPTVSQPAELNDPNKLLSFVDQLQQDNPFEGLKRIPRRYVRIPGDQKAMLESQDSWFKPNLDGRPRHAAIPAQALSDVTRFMDRVRNAILQQSEGSKFATSSSGSVENIEQGSAAEEGSSESDSDRVEDMDQSNRKSLAKLQVTSRNFSSSGPDIVEDVDEEDDDDCMSWSPSPEPEEAISQQLAKPQRSSGNQSSQIPNSHGGASQPWKPGPKTFVRKPIDIPPSSPTGIEELELAPIHAIGDVIEAGDVQEGARPDSSQELPSSHSRSSKYVQVEQTPLSKSRGPSHAPSRQSLTRGLDAEQHASGNISSDPIIPATFNDTSSSSKHVSSSTEQKETEKITVALPTLGPDCTPLLSRSREDESGLLVGISYSNEQPPHAIDSARRMDPPRRLDILPASSAPAPPGNQQMLNNSENPTFSQSIPASSPPGPVSSQVNEAEQQCASPVSSQVNESEQQCASTDKIPGAPKPSKKHRATGLDTMTEKRVYSKLNRSMRPIAESHVEMSPEADMERNQRIQREIQQAIQEANRVVAEQNAANTTELPISESIVDEEIPAEAHGGPGDSARSKDARKAVFLKNFKEPLYSAESEERNDVGHARRPSERQTTRSLAPTTPTEVGVRGAITKPVIDAQPRRSSRPELVQEDDIVEHPTPQNYDEGLEPSVNDSPRRNEITPAEDAALSDTVQSIYDRYKSHYPDYCGSEWCFTKALVYMEWMEESGNGLHRFLCDDFLRVYPEYEATIIKLSPEKRITGRVYYNRNIQRPVYQQGLIVPENFSVDLLTLNQKDVEKVRSRFNTPATGAESRGKAVSPVTGPVEHAEETISATPSPLKAQVLGPGQPSPILGCSDRFVRPHARERFFETPSQLQNTTNQPGLPADSEASVKTTKITKRALPWIPSNPAQKSSLPKRPTQISPINGSSGSKKRQLTTDQSRRKTLPPYLRAQTSKSSPASRAEEEPGPVSRDRTSYKAPSRPSSESAFLAASSSPEIHGFTERWVADLQLSEGALVGSTQTASPAQPVKGHVSKEQLQPVRNSSGESSTKRQPRRKMSYADFVAQQVLRRRASGGLSSRGSTPRKSTGFCTTPKERAPKVFKEPETQPWN